MPRLVRPAHATPTRPTASRLGGRRRRSVSLALAVVLAVVAGAVGPVGGPLGAAPSAPAATPRGVAGFDEPGIPVRPASERYVREAYQSFLGRSVDEPGLQFWGERLDAATGTSARGSFARLLALSTENLEDEVRGVYDLIGAVPPDTVLARHVADLKAGRDSLERILVWLVTDEQYYLASGSPEGFVIDIYEDLLGRTPSAEERSWWLSLGTTDEAWVRRVGVGIVFSSERLAPILDDSYLRVLGRASDPAGVQFWIGRLRRQASILDVDRFFLASNEAWTMGCSTLDSTRCLLPFPNDLLTLPDPTTDTGKRVVLKPDWVPGTASGTAFDPTEWNRQDGFSPGSAILLHPGAIDVDETDFATLADIGRSVEPDSPVALIDTTTGELVPHWVELDANATTAAERALAIRPARNLVDGRTYVVALHDVRDTAGQVIPASDRFTDLLAEDVVGWRGEREAILTHFAAAAAQDEVGIDPADLYLAWSFTVASTRNLAERIVHMTDETLRGDLETDVPPFTITKVDPPRGDDGTTRVEGTFTGPSYLTGDGGPGTRLNLGADHLPERNGTRAVPFVCTVPEDAAEPSRAGLYGHGLLGEGAQANSSYVRALAAEHDITFCGVDYVGMADEDLPAVATILQDLSKFSILPDRNQQGLLNFMILGRLMTSPEGLVTHAAFQHDDASPAVDGSDLVYYGLSQGGIMGGALVAVNPDLTRGVLGVPGMNYSTLLHRSVDFDPFFGLLAAGYPSALDRMIMLSVIQMLWDRGEGNGYANHMTTDPLPGNVEKEVLLQPAFGDHQVTQFAADVQARTYGAATNDPPLEDGRVPDATPLWGIDRIASWPHVGSAIIYWDSGTPTPPYTNVPPRPPTYGEDPHSDPRRDPDARVQISQFLRPGGQVVDTCAGAPCLVDFVLTNP